VKSELPAVIYETLQLLLQVCGLLWCKVLPKRAIPTLIALVLKAVCMVELHLPVSERDIKLHGLFELALSIPILGAPVPCMHKKPAVRKAKKSSLNEKLIQGGAFSIHFFSALVY